jgi:hypothetical protein
MPEIKRPHIPPELLRSLKGWHDHHPDFTDDEFEEAILEIEEYCRVAWRVFRQVHSTEDLPDEL